MPSTLTASSRNAPVSYIRKSDYPNGRAMAVGPHDSSARPAYAFAFAFAAAFSAAL